MLGRIGLAASARMHFAGCQFRVKPHYSKNNRRILVRRHDRACLVTRNFVSVSLASSYGRFRFTRTFTHCATNTIYQFVVPSPPPPPYPPPLRATSVLLTARLRGSARDLCLTTKHMVFAGQGILDDDATSTSNTEKVSSFPFSVLTVDVVVRARVYICA